MNPHYYLHSDKSKYDLFSANLKVLLPAAGSTSSFACGELISSFHILLRNIVNEGFK